MAVSIPGGRLADQSRTCEVCDAPIDQEQIDDLPETHLCTEHAWQSAKYGGEFLLTGTQSSPGKEGSLKKNYGDVSVRQKRNTDGLRRLTEDHDRRKTV